jgi:N-carbamoyl-L-amino-acid hydrolase
MSIPADRSVRPAAWPAGSRPGGELRVDGARMLRRLAEISRIGARPGRGITRLGLTPEETEARAYLAGECHRDGLVARTDQAGNLVVRRAGADHDRPALLLGSHIDTVADGGRLDGTYGVMAACEVLRVLAEHDVELDVEPVVVAFTNEEGAFFPYPFFGSLGLVGQVDTDHAKRMVSHDVALPDALRAAGGDLDAIADAAWAPGSVAGYLELHIEQGPVLEEASLPIGVVQAITGRSVLDVTVRGSQDHAGTTPMRMRRDALTVASRAVLAIERLARTRDLCRVATVGRFEVEPNTTNVIPGTVRLTAEIRDGRAERLRTAEQAITTELAQLASATDTVIEVRLDPITQPVATDDVLSGAIADAADELGLRHLRMDSGAGHDAQIVAAIAPIGMIFVPSRDGVSHAPQEDTDDAHLVAGADVLLHSVLNAGGILGAGGS